MKDAYVVQATHLLGGTSLQLPSPARTRDEEIHDDGGPCRYIAGACNLCGAVPPGPGDLAQVPSPGRTPVRRGTSNSNERGSVHSRRRRREWLVQTYRADVDVVKLPFPLPYPLHTDLGLGVPACRCYRCGLLLTADTVTVDRIIPGCRGGTYRRDNIRPACGACNSVTGATTRRKS